MTPQSPTTHVPASALVPPPSPTPVPSVLSRTSASMPSLPIQRNPRHRVFMNAKEAVIASSSLSPLTSTTTDAPLAIFPPPTTPDVSPFPMSETVGSKRRHSAIADPSAPNVSPTASGSSRRRTRSSRNLTSAFAREANDQNQSHISDAMEVEEEGRERKRVARR